MLCASSSALDFKEAFAWASDFIKSLRGVWAQVGEVEFSQTTTTSTSTTTTIKDNWRLIESRKTGNHTLCEDIESIRLSDLCFNDLARNLNNTHYCTRIINEETKDRCFRDLAVKLSNEVYCNLIKDAETRKKCLDESPLKVCLTCRG